MQKTYHGHGKWLMIDDDDTHDHKDICQIIHPHSSLRFPENNYIQHISCIVKPLLSLLEGELIWEKLFYRKQRFLKLIKINQYDKIGVQ